MTKNLRLNDLQLVLLSNAAARDNGSIVPLRESCSQDKSRIGKAVASLLRRGLVEELPVTDRSLTWREQDQDLIGLFITDAGRTTIGADDGPTQSGDDKKDQTQSEPAPAIEGAAEGEQSLQPAEATASPAGASPRAGSKIAAVIALLERKEGATLDEMVATTGWLPHTTRAALTGLKKKGHVIAKTKRGEVTCYRIAAES